MIMFSVLTYTQFFGQLHSFFWYFPVILFCAALVADFFYYIGRPKALIVGHWLIIAGVLSCIPTLVTGMEAEVNFDPSNLFVEKHRHLGWATAISSSFYAGLRIAAMIWPLPLKPVHYLFLSLLLVALVSWASDYGWLIRIS